MADAAAKPIASAPAPEAGGAVNAELLGVPKARGVQSETMLHAVAIRDDFWWPVLKCGS